jgi:hypothetical protein
MLMGTSTKPRPITFFAQSLIRATVAGDALAQPIALPC